MRRFQVAIDGKYGRVTTEFGDIGDDEPVVVFRAQDQLLPDMMELYLDLCRRAGSPQRHLDLIAATTDKIRQWQGHHHTQIPRSDMLRASDDIDG
jgi:hypothetical protein